MHPNKIKPILGLSFASLLIFGVTAFDYSIMARSAFAIGAWSNGAPGDTDILHAPMAWCIYEDTPVLDNTITIAAENTADEKLWRRHERPTNNIYNNPAGISFRSNIMDNFNNPNLTFPTIPDSNKTDFGVIGDMRGEDVNNFGDEFEQSLVDCVNAWIGEGAQFANIGITTVNVGLFHDATDYVGIGGWGGCARIGNSCVAPYDGHLVIIDNVYLHPTSPDRTWPDGSGRQFGIMDEFGVVAGHELGHALGLDHRNTSTQNLMNWVVSDNNGDNIVDNMDLNQNEIDVLRSNVVNVPGFERDPPNQFVSGNFIETKQVEKADERKKIPDYLDISILKSTLDKKNNELTITQQLRGLIPENNDQTIFFITLIDSDNDKSTGSKLQKIGDKTINDVNFDGADHVLVSAYNNNRVISSVYEFSIDPTNEKLAAGSFVQINPKTANYVGNLATFEAWPYYLPVEDTQTGKILPIPKHVESVPVFHLMSVKLDNKITKIDLEKPFLMQSLTGILAGDSIEIVDKFDNSDKGVEFTMSEPNFPHCYPEQNDVVAGEKVKIRAEGLIPNKGTHLIFGLDVAARGQTDNQGSISLEFNTSPDMEPGIELITIGSDGTALTADCTVNIVEKKIPSIVDATDYSPWWLCLIIIIILVIVIIILVVLRILHK